MLKFCGCASMASCTRWEWLQHSKAIFRMHDVCTITQEWNSIACKHACWSNLLFTYCRNNDYMCQNWYICLLNHVDTHNAERILYAYLNAVDTEACMCRVCPNITMCVRMSVGSRNRTIHNVCHISLHVSSSTQPTHQSRHMEHSYTCWMSSASHNNAHITQTA